MFTYQTEKRLKYYDEVIEIYKKTGLSAYRIAKMNLVPVGKHTIETWIANFVAENETITPQTLMQSKGTQTNEKLEALQKEVADLRKQLKYQEMRADAYDTMIDIAEKKFNIPIRKKAGAKQ